jgi:stage II sporulation protein GA (sporulation sigma-E factor processing peptidase)
VAKSPVIYIDVVFAVNFLMDFLILWSVARFGQFRTSWLKILAGALVGSFYSLIIFFPGSGFFETIGVKLLVSMIMILISFSWHSVKYFLQALGCFYLVSFMVGGAMLGGIYFLQGSLLQGSFFPGIFFLSGIPSVWLLAGLASLAFLSYLGSSLIKKGLFRKLYLVSTVVCFGEKRIAARSLVDTGNQLRDPLTRCPVMILEYSLLKDVLPIHYIDYIPHPQVGNLEQDDPPLPKKLPCNYIYEASPKNVPFCSRSGERRKLAPKKTALSGQFLFPIL